MRLASAAVWGSPDLRRLVVGAFAWGLAEMATWVAVLVVAYDAGGPAVAGIAVAVQLVPAGLAAPLGGLVGDRWRRGRVYTVSVAAAAVASGAAALVSARSEGLVALLVLAVVLSVLFAVIRPTQGSLVPQVATTPTEASAANGALGVAAATSSALGPLVAAALLGVGPWAVFAVAAGVLVVGASVVGPIGRQPNPTSLAASSTWSSARDLFATKGTRPLFVLAAAFNLTVGALEILVVALAIDALGIGDRGVGLLAGAAGVGGMIGSSVVFGLAGRRRLTPVVVGAAFAWGVSIAALGFVPGFLVGVVVLFVGGVAEMAIEISGQTMLQRVVPPHVMSGAFGVAEGLRQGTMALGSLGAGVLVASIGLMWSAVVVGLVVPVVAFAFRPFGDHIDAGVAASWSAVDAIGRSSLFSSLSMREREALAHASGEVEVAQGATIITEGDQGDGAYLVLSGRLSVRKAGTEVAVLGPGDHVGEIALLRGRPRTATVVAVDDCRLLAIDRFSFLCVVAGSRVAARGLDGDMDRRLGELGGG